MTNEQLAYKTQDDAEIFGDELPAFFGKTKDDLTKAARVVMVITPEHLASIADFNAVVALDNDQLTKYKNAKEKLNSENFVQLGDTFAAVIESLNHINAGLDKLKPQEMASIFNTAANGQDVATARTAFIAALKNDENELGHILSSDAKGNDNNKFQQDFDNAAGDLFDKFAKYAKKGPDGKFVENSLSLTPDTKTKILEDIKAFIGMLVKCALIIPAVLEYVGIGKDFLQSDRSKRVEALDSLNSFEKMLKNTDAKNQITNENAKSVIGFNL